MNTQENNKLIAEFMGYKLARCNNGLAWESPYQKVVDDIFKIHGRLWRNEDGFYKWGKSWDWIMPVLEVIATAGHEITINWNVCEGGCLSCKIKCYENEDELIKTIYKDMSTVQESAYHSVIEFIKWYNENK